MTDIAIKQLVESEDTYRAFINEYNSHEIGLVVNLRMVQIASTEAFSNPTQWAEKVVKVATGQTR